MTAFITEGPLNPDEHSDIIVQRSELDGILHHIANEDAYVALRSGRQTGKTTLLYQIQERLHKHNYGIVYIDLKGLDDLGEADFYPTMCDEIWEGLDEMINAVEIAVQPHQVTDQFAFSDYLIWLSTHTPQVRRLILILDEIGGVPDEISSTFFDSLRSFFNKGRRQSKDRDLCRKVMFIFSGALDMERLIRGENSPLSSVCSPFSLNDFSRKQVHSLASNLRDFPGCLQAIADEVYEWCAGHPYLTQRLYALIDESHTCRSASGDALAEAVNQLVLGKIVYGSDVNLRRILKHLRENKHYQDPVLSILNGKRRKSIMFQEDLLSLGIIKRSSDWYLNIHNKIYEEALKDFFEET